ncbi:MAG: tail fiber domain-containing protein [Bacteroidales bacterium]|nr:tail fiber domain-containing protein [Bacteroidales bacterium]
MKLKKHFLLVFFIWCISVCSIYAQIEVLSNGTVHAGNTSTALFDPTNTRFEVNVPKAVIKNGSRGFQFFQSTDVVPEISFARVVMSLTGLSNQGASIGRPDNQMNRIYSVEYYLNGANLGTLVGSDANLKTNIRELPSMAERISKLRPVMYDFVRNGSGEDVSKDPTYQNRVGFIAQEVREIFPDLVATTILGEDKDVEELLSLDYAGLIPYLTKTIQELNEKVEKLLQQINFASIFDIDASSHASQQTQQVANHKETNILYQNTPNLFNSATTITYQLAENATNAKICIYNLTGKQLQCYNLPTIKGKNAIEVRALSLQSGMYLYSLIVDGMLIDTKRMILTD